jgi:adenine deaminase
MIRTSASPQLPTYKNFWVGSDEKPKAGLTPMEPLQTTTRNPAEYLNKLNSMGTVEKGKLADLVLLNATPLESIENGRKISAVVVKGRLLDRKALDRLLAQVEAGANNQRSWWEPIRWHQ